MITNAERWDDLRPHLPADIDIVAPPTSVPQGRRGIAFEARCPDRRCTSAGARLKYTSSQELVLLTRLSKHAFRRKQMSQPEEPVARWRGIAGLLSAPRAQRGAIGLFAFAARSRRPRLGDAGVPVSGWLLAVALYLVSQIVSGIRWASLARPIGFHLSWLRFQQLYFEGMFFSLCLPSSIGGDVVKSLRLGGDGRGRILAACTVLADRLAGLVAVLLIGLTAFARRTYSLGLAQTLGVGLGLLAVALIGTRIGFALLHWPSGRIPAHHPVAHFSRACCLITIILTYSGTPSVGVLSCRA